MGKQKKKRRFGKPELGLCLLLTVIVSGILQYKRFVLEEKLAAMIEEKQLIERQYEEEKRRSEELEHKEIDITTREFVEDVAREKFGLLYKNEIMFEPEN